MGKGIWWDFGWLGSGCFTLFVGIFCLYLLFLVGFIAVLLFVGFSWIVTGILRSILTLQQQFHQQYDNPLPVVRCPRPWTVPTDISSVSRTGRTRRGSHARRSHDSSLHGRSPVSSSLDRRSPVRSVSRPRPWDTFVDRPP